MKLYYAEAKVHLKKSNLNYVVQRAFQDTKNLVTTQLSFVNLFGNVMFLVAPLIDQQLKRQVEQYNVFIFSNGIYLSKWKPTWNHM